MFARLRTRKGSLLEDVRPFVFSTRLPSAAKVVAATAISMGQGAFGKPRGSRVLELDLLM
jgi:hypothetical protein